ncbi:MAG: heat-inducible transcriptional repressor HrcA [Eubacteriales bacterium]|nr:heat-inducible transcriptional repressor HrcA [Eubacteriales bacterium]MDD3198445.1 heat-inducible transcriptional repressor HrcA [Eubacteriales bacterium]MDD3503860.1 heat-inducible transcriptional repressor HrcA [Eubacteriales bacterium]MDD4682929.1 heat-inducible transcriptional repressor HrcA [Eubacteriales bacterium]
MGLNARKNLILKSVVDDYIGTAEPVGSKSLVNKYSFNVSPATIRNEMAELEELGYLEQPHTSAGRVPSDKGYRAYVDHLLQVEDLPQKEAEVIRSYLRENMDEVTQLIRRAASVLSEKTDYTSLVLSPQYRKSHLKQIKMLMIEPGRALVVVVLSAGVVKDRLVRIPEMLDAQQLMQVASAIEDGLSGMTLDDITLVTVAAAARHTPLPESLINQVMYEAYLSIKQADQLDLYLDGSHRLLAQPEFQDVRKAHDFLETLNRDKLVAGYMSELKEDQDISHSDYENNEELVNNGTHIKCHAADDPAYMVRIGQEILLDGLKECSFITTSYKIGDTVAGKIGVIGPKRMAYGKVISHINFVKMTVNEQIRRLANGEDENGGIV